jgi:iron complex outermembrane receptor protein
MSKPTVGIRRLLSGPFLACATGAALAQSAALPQELPRVEITGSRIKHVEAGDTSPVQVLDREDIRRTGATTLKELFESFWTVGYGTSDTGGRGTYAAGSTSAGLRNLGNQATLVLLNSRRVSPYPLAEYSQIYVNIDALPLEAVERVEVLRSGGSAIYGSDAIAGVINIITRSGYEGIYARAGQQQSLFSHRFGTRNASLTGGFGNLEKDRYNLLLSAETYHRDRVVWSDVLPYVNPALTAPFPSFGSFSTYSYPGNVIPAGPLPGCAPDRLIGGLCRYNRYERFEATPAADRFNFMAAARLQLQPGLLGFSEFLYSQTETKYLSPFQPYGPNLAPVTWGDPLTNAGRTFYYRGLPTGHPLNPTGQDDADFRYRFVDGPSESSGAAKQYRLLAGLRGTLDNFEWESAAGVMGGEARLKLRGQFSDSGFRQVIGNYDIGQVDSQFFSRDYRIAQPNSAAVIDRLFPEYGYTGRTRQIFIDGKLSGEATRYEGRAVNLATGFDLRHDRFAVTPSDVLRSGDIVGEGFLASSAARTHGAVFSEVTWPLTQSLELQAAGRLDKFPNFAAHLSPKLGLRFEADPSLVLRGTVEAGFRAPNLSESAPSKRFGFDGGISDPKRCPQAQRLAADLRAAAALLPAGSAQRVVLEARADNLVNAECFGSLTTEARNNPDLKPETSRSIDLGLAFRPARDVGVAVDYWQITRRNEIGLRGTNELLAAESILPPGVIDRSTLAQDRSFSPAEQLAYGVTAAPITSIIGRFENQARTTTSGIDFTAHSRLTTPAGPLDLQVNSTYMLTYRIWYVALGGYGDNLVGRGVPRVRTDISATLRSGPFTNALTWYYSSPTTLQGDYFDSAYSPENCPATTGWSPDQCRQASYQFFSYHVAYNGAKDLTLGANVRNLFNRRPPVNLRSLQQGGGGLIPQDVNDVMGRMLRVTVEYRFR